MELYDTIGVGYRQQRRQDPRIATEILRALGASSPVVNVGAGAGSYEPRDRPVIAVEPSLTMIQQRGPGSPPAVRGTAASLPFPDASFEASLAVLTVHHWPDRAAGLRELRRVARSKTVIFTWDPAAEGFWLTRYFPEIVEINHLTFPTMTELEHHLGPVTVTELQIPHDCTDGFLGAYWRRPEAYLRPEVRAAISTFSKIADIRPGLSRLREDIKSGAWHRHHAEILSRSALDLGYRLVVTQ